MKPNQSQTPAPESPKINMVWAAVFIIAVITAAVQALQSDWTTGAIFLFLALLSLPHIFVNIQE